MPTMTWGELMDSSDSEKFIGRANELSIFRDNLLSSRPRSLVFFIFGQGGVGKTELLKQYKALSEENDYIVATSDESQGDIPSLLDKFARDIESKGYKLKQFTDKLKKYQQLKHEIESDPSAPMGLASFIGQSVARVGLSLASEVPVLRQGIDLIDRDAFSTQTGEWAKYLAQKWSNNREDLRLIKNPVLILSNIFFADLNEVGEDNKIILCFDNYEATRDYFDGWLTKIRDYSPSLNIRLAIACRTEPGHLWEKLGNAVSYIPLDVFSPEEAQRFLDLANINDPERREEILEFSGRLPILMSWLSSPNSNKPDPAFPSADIVDLFLRWVNETHRRIVALDAAIPHFFNLDVLMSLISDNATNIERDFDWLIKQPFINQRERGWQYHSVVRRIMARYQRDRSKTHYGMLHNQTANYYLDRVNELHLDEESQWENEQWQDFYVEYIYHSVMGNPTVNWNKFINFLVMGLKYRFTLAKRTVEILLQPESVDNLSHEQIDAIEFISTQLKLIDSGNRWDGIQLYEFLEKMPFLDTKSKAFILFLRGEANRTKRDYSKALGCLDAAIDINPNFFEAITEKGAILSIQKEYAKALVEFDRALEIYPYHWAYERKGSTLYSLHRYPEALNVLNDAEKTNTSCAETYALRGGCFLQLGQLEEAMIDLNKSLEIDPENHWARLRRGEVYLESQKYDFAIAEFDAVMPISKGFKHESLKNIGLVFAAQENYKEAAEKFILSLETTPDCSHCWTALIRVYEKIHEREEIPNLLAVSRFPNIDFSVSVHLCRASAYSTHGYKEAIDELNSAIKLDPRLKISLPEWIDINGLGLKLGMAGQYEDAIKCFEFDAYLGGFVYKYNKAVAMTLWKGAEFAEEEITSAEEALKNLEQAEGDGKGLAIYGFAGLEAVKENKQSALDLLRQAIAIAPGVVVFAHNTDPAWRSLTSDPEFQEIISGQK
jgi:tetratricopeptide (TPR) repeat protein